MKKHDALEFAHEFEVKGAILYLRLAAKTENLLAKEVFYSLAKQEIEHARRIDSIYNSIRSNKGWNAGENLNSGDMEAEIKKFFKSASRAQLKKNAENIQGYETAMNMERKGYNAYKEFYGSAKSDGEKEFFKQMMNEEDAHYESLVNVYAYLTNTVDWLQEDESRTWNWMNT